MKKDAVIAIINKCDLEHGIHLSSNSHRIQLTNNGIWHKWNSYRTYCQHFIPFEEINSITVSSPIEYGEDDKHNEYESWHFAIQICYNKVDSFECTWIPRELNKLIAERLGIELENSSIPKIAKAIEEQGLREDVNSLCRAYAQNVSIGD